MTDLNDIVQLSISDFRSLAGPVTVPLDAPIVLIHGPNGSGKTSILSALELALTGDIPSMRRDDQHFAQHLVHEGAQEAKLEITRRGNSSKSGGTYTITNGVMTGEPYLDVHDRKFFGERCYLAQSMLGRLLEIYQKSSVDDGESALMQFVKDLLGLDQLDALVEGLNDAGDRRRTRNLVPEYRNFETRVKRIEDDAKQLNEELAGLNSQRVPELEALTAAFHALFGDDGDVGADLRSAEHRLQRLSTDSNLLEATRRRTELQSIAKAWSGLPQDADTSVRSKIEAEEEAARSAADEWRNGTGAQLEEIITGLRKTFPDLASWSSTSPEAAHAAAVRRVESEVARLKALIDKDAENQVRENQLADSVAREEAREQVIDSQIALLAGNADEYAAALAALAPHVHTEDCPVCGRNYAEVSKGEPLTIRLQRTIAKLTDDAGKLSALSSEKNASSTRLTQLRRDLATILTQRLSEDIKSTAALRQADMAESKVALDRTAKDVSRGSALLNAEATLKNRLAAFRDRDRLATDLRTTILRIANEMKREDLQDLSFENILATLQTFVAAEISRLEALQSQRNRALLALQSVARIDQRRQAVTKEIADNSETVKVLKSALTTLDSLRGQAKTIGETARRARTAVVRRVFNDSLNKLWRDLFIRLAPTEPFVPAFHIPESDSDDIATLETVHRSGKTGGTPGAMLSAGNLNTAALTLFLALHFSVGTRLPWLVLDDPVQNMDEVYIAQFAALLRTLSKTHGTKLIISVHERPLFEYLRLELSPAFERDRLLTLELRRTQGEKTVVDPKINTYAVDAVAA